LADDPGAGKSFPQDSLKSPGSEKSGQVNSARAFSLPQFAEDLTSLVFGVVGGFLSGWGFVRCP
jgi:hypothetical protein